MASVPGSALLLAGVAGAAAVAAGDGGDIPCGPELDAAVEEEEEEVFLGDAARVQSVSAAVAAEVPEEDYELASFSSEVGESADVDAAAVSSSSSSQEAAVAVVAAAAAAAVSL